MTGSPNLLRGRAEPVEAPGWVPDFLMRVHLWLSRPPRDLGGIDAEYYAVTNWSAVFGLAGHSLFLVTFAIVGPYQLALFNIASVVVWGVGLALSRRGRMIPALAACTLEVVAHNAYAALLLGWDAGFQYFYLVAALLWATHRGIDIGRRLAVAIALCLAVVAGSMVLPDRPPIPVADPMVTSVFGVLNQAWALIMALGIALYLPLVIDQTRAQLREAIQAGSYELLRVLNRGGMGEVWLARHRMLVRPAAVKLIRQEGESAEVRSALAERFEREAQATAVLRSVHTVELYDYGITDEGNLYYAMELLDGIDLDHLVKTHGPVDPGRVVYLLRQTCDSLADAHANGLIHRDIKPANLCICRMGTARDFVKVLDFGLVKSTVEARPANTELTALGSVIGTPAFMAPEQVRRAEDIDARTDLYALGCVAWWLLTGRLVFEADTPMDMAVAHLTKSPDPPSMHAELPVPAALDALVMQCLEKDPENRPQTAVELRDALLAIDIEWDNARATSWWEAHHVERPSLPPDGGMAPGSSRFIRKEMG